MRHPSLRSALAIALVITLQGCGGGGGGGSVALPTTTAATTATAATPVAPAPSSSETPTAIRLGGLAATGAPVANAAVSVQCLSGAAIDGRTDADGRWTVTLSAQQAFPCLVSVSGGPLPVGQTLHSVALDAATLNVTPLTGLIVASAAQAAPATLASGAPLAAAAQALAKGLARVNASLRASGYAPLAGDPLTTAFKAQAGDAHDDLIAQLMRSLADEATSYGDLLARVAAAGDAGVPIPLTHVFTSAELGAMPPLNKASLAVADGALTMTLDGGAAATANAFVGGGTGNKAVLQLPGLDGARLADFKDMTLELESGSGAYVPYVNFFVDLQCDRSPLSPTATIAEVQKRRRVVIYDPWNQFVVVENALSASRFTAARFDYTTPGWRVSAGDPLGSDLAVTDYSGTRNFTSFDFAKYPEACIVDGISADNGMFRDESCQNGSALPGSALASCGKVHSGAIVVFGGSTNFDPASYKLRKVRYGGFNPRSFSFE